MSDFDGPPATGSVDQPSPMGSDPIVRALVHLEEVVRRSLDREKQRADSAEHSLAEARRELAAVRAELAVARSREMDERVFKDLGAYLEESMRAQRGLVAITRQLLGGIGAAQRGPATTPQVAPSSDTGSRPAPPTIVLTERAGSATAPGAPAQSLPGVYEWHAGVDPVTDEHRIIDQSNRADMERLDSPSRRFAGSTAFKRRNLLGA